VCVCVLTNFIRHRQITQLIKQIKTSGFGLSLWPSSGFITKVQELKIQDLDLLTEIVSAYHIFTS
jgi:hypothetical protein